ADSQTQDFIDFITSDAGAEYFLRDGWTRQ
nr:accessory colonization factor [Vibrio cholerae]